MGVAAMAGAPRILEIKGPLLAPHTDAVLGFTFDVATGLPKEVN